MKKLLLAAFLLGFCLVTTPAMADPIVNGWSYDLLYGFENWNPNAAVTTDLLNANGDPTKLSWGNNLQSSIQVEGTDPVPPAGYGESSGPYTLNTTQTVMSFTHNNFPITGETLESTTLYSTFALSLFGSVLDEATRTFEIEFWETLNTGNPYPPVGVEPEDWYSVAEDEDYFWLKNPEDLVTTLQIGAYYYTITFTIEGLVELPEKALAHWAGDGITEGALGLITQEGQVSEFGSSFTITAAPVPEPGTMILFGMGMIGLAGAMRRKKM